MVDDPVPAAPRLPLRRLPPIGTDHQCARDLGAFVRALRAVDPVDGPLKTGTSRGAPLAACDAWAREWTAKAGDRIDRRAVLEVSRAGRPPTRPTAAGW